MEGLQMLLENREGTTFEGKQIVSLKMNTFIDCGSHPSNNTEGQQETGEATHPKDK